MQTKLSAALLITLTAVGCGHRDRGTDNGAAASASGDTTLHRDTSAMTAPAATTDTLADSSKTKGYHSDSVSNTTTKPKRGGQTQSGVTDKTGHSTLGPGIRKARPDQNQPVTAKGDTLNTSPIPGLTDSTTRRPNQMPVRQDTLPQPLDTRKDSTVTDSLKPTSDSLRPNPPQPVDSTHADSTKPKP
jgi:hypothetical protein